MKKPLHDVVLERRLVCDGAMGTQLILAGLEAGNCGEYWNLTHPDSVLAIQSEYVGAGVDCLITNTFGANRLMLRRHRLVNEVRTINQAAVRIAREAFGDRDGYVFGDLGPLGAILEPYGELSASEALEVYQEQASALVDAGADAIIIETQTSLDELGAAIEAAKSSGARYVVASLAYDLLVEQSIYVTMMGVLPDQAAKFVEEKGADMIGLNCGTGMDMRGAAKVIRLYRENCPLPTMAQPNAGVPGVEGGKAVYKQLPADMASGVPDVLRAGTNIVGSCCGSTPAHTRAIRQVVDEFNAKQ
jgi:5-methyltetrahydrofolate--homocysteine methyltransferase